jgi:hypothetical protein
MKPAETTMVDNMKNFQENAVEVKKGDIKIVVLNSGYLYVGRVTIKDGFVVIANAKKILKRGIKEDLSELVNGPLPDTKLYNVGTVQIPVHDLFSLHYVKQSKWKSI